MLAGLRVDDARVAAGAILGALPTGNAIAYGTEASVLLALGGRRALSLRARPGGRPWERLGTFLAASSGHVTAGYLGFDLHAAQSPGISIAPYASAWLFVPEIVIELRRNGWRPLAGDTRSLAPVFDKAFDGLPPGLRAVSALDVGGGGSARYRRSVEEALRWIGGSQDRRVTVARRTSLRRTFDMKASLASRPLGSPVSRSFYLRSPEIEMVGHSPELLAIGDRAAFRTFKLSGTYPRSRDPAADAKLLAGFRRDAKIRHEHASSMESTKTALARLGAVKRLNTSVLELPRLRHLMTVFRTQPKLGSTVAECLRAVFPAGACPKEGGLACLGRAEGEGRGAYYGLVGLVRPDGSFSFSQVLRAVFRHDGKTYAWVGAAITSASQPEREYRETRLKLADIVGACRTPRPCPL